MESTAEPNEDLYDIGDDGLEEEEAQYAEYEQVRFFCVTLDDWYGSQPSSPLLDARVKDKSPADLRFFRTNDGDLEISSDVVAGWLRTNMRQQDTSDAVACSPIIFSYALLGPPASFPVIDQRTRKGSIMTFESLPSGTKFEMVFSVPTRGFCGIDDFVALVVDAGANPVRGLSPARARKAGRFAVTRYVNMGSVKSGAAALTTALSLLPKGKQFDEARKFYAEQIARKEQ